MRDLRNQCKKFLSAECPNDCHYAENSCKYFKEVFISFVDEIFIDHHDSSGLDDQEINDLIDESTWEQRYMWLKKNGYELEE